MSEEHRSCKCCSCCPHGLVETELAIIIVLLSAFLLCYCLDNDDDHCKKEKKDCKDKKDNKDCKSW